MREQAKPSGGPPRICHPPFVLVMPPSLERSCLCAGGTAQRLSQSVDGEVMRVRWWQQRGHVGGGGRVEGTWRRGWWTWERGGG